MSILFVVDVFELRAAQIFSLINVDWLQNISQLSQFETRSYLEVSDSATFNAMVAKNRIVVGHQEGAESLRSCARSAI